MIKFININKEGNHLINKRFIITVFRLICAFVGGLQRTNEENKTLVIDYHNI